MPNDTKEATDLNPFGMFDGFDLGGDSAEQSGGDEPSRDEVSESAVANAMPGRGSKVEPIEIGDDDDDDDGYTTEDVTSNSDEGLAKPEAQDSDKANIEKRFKDTQRAFQEEHQKRLDLERQVAEMRSRIDSGELTKKEEKQVADILSGFKESFDDDPQAAIETALNALTSKIKQLEMAEVAKAGSDLDRQEAEARQIHKDYDTYVNGDFISELQASPSLMKEWEGKGRTAKAAYEVAKRNAEFKEYIRTGKMPTAQTPSQSTQQRRGPETIADLPSAPPSRGGPKGDVAFDTIEDVQARLFSGL